MTRPRLTDAEYARLLPAADFELPPGFRVPSKAEFEQLLREPSLTSTTGPYVGGYLSIGYRSIPLTEDEARAFFAGKEQTVTRLTDADRDVLARAREVGPTLRASAGDRDRLAGWLLKELADLAERLDGSKERSEDG